ncbi:hypothetical protein GGTG_10695 [Gaeumannomyces tritici R3-111a-1]|uniref:Uncharacterized protein n=1 Tax=Gaeumannomyces tritici (strain R3-111a-1) TaxID=644352 RepID=J3PB21_GAET3|nr:hypothetical protein GGTG_10695 [Gaeumannomyces tritici R3-111a-1]EJT71437.1 hypothetical protein GGTG_10695 [Gaeumannomyces tritici R3-111a-1]
MEFLASQNSIPRPKGSLILPDLGRMQWWNHGSFLPASRFIVRDPRKVEQQTANDYRESRVIHELPRREVLLERLGRAAQSGGGFLIWQVARG